ncbi:hypothetical protein KY285_015433 [Solanum tuberosum]|nr:hypothetical protein KY285_015433 [Solanum tuberosum]
MNTGNFPAVKLQHILQATMDSEPDMEGDRQNDGGKYELKKLLFRHAFINEYGVRIHFMGNLKLLDEPVRVAAEKAMQVTAKNTKSSLLICVAYTSTDEIVHAIQASCQEKWNEIQELNANQSQNAEITDEKMQLDHVIKLEDIERFTYTGLAPDPDVLIRTSGVSHISNFLLWQTTNCIPQRYSFLILVYDTWYGKCWNFQRLHPRLEKEKKL